jgi:hypothetical protein
MKYFVKNVSLREISGRTFYTARRGIEILKAGVLSYHK